MSHAKVSDRVHWIRDPAQVGALASRVRQRIVDRLEAVGPASVAELARSLSVAPDRLYYHVKLLTRRGLLRAAGTRGEGRAREELFDLIARRWHLRYDPADAALVEAINKLTRTMLRQAERDFEAGWQAEDVRVAGPLRDLWSLRLEATLTRTQLRELGEHLQAIVALLRQPERASHGRHVALTWVLAPVTRASEEEDDP